ncbi:unnamed protein product, partial [Prunus brigantina]
PPLIASISLSLAPISATVTITSTETLTHIDDDDLSTSISHSLSPLSTYMLRDGVSVYSPQGWYHAKVVLVP